MTPAEAIGMLDRQIGEHGQTVTIRKQNSTAGEVTLKAFVRGMKADEIAGAITQSDRKVVLSPTNLDPAAYPKPGGFIVIDDAPLSIIGKPELVKINDTIVRINVAVKG